MKKIIATAIIAVIATAFTWQCIGAWQDSQTTDEAVHLSAGRSYWQTGSWRLNPEHPALFKLWATLPLVLLPHTQIPTNTESWRSGNEWSIGAEYLYLSPAQTWYDGRVLLWLGRFQMILIWLGLATTIALWTWRRWGPWASLVATSLLAYDPNFLGHGHLVTNDVAVAGAYLLTWLVLRRMVERPSWRTLGWLSLVFAAAQLTKYSAVILWPLVPLVMVVARWYRQPGGSWHWIGRTVLSFLVVTSLATWMTYGFRIDRIDHDPRIAQLWSERQQLVAHQAVQTVPPLIQTFIHLSDPATATGKILDGFQHLSIPAYWYWRGFFSATSHNYYGHAAYLLGRASTLGWWYYFPVAVYVKTPIVLLAVLAVAIILFVSRFIHDLRRRRPWRELVPFDWWITVWPPLVFFLWSMTSHINIGVRHIFPSYVFFPLAGGWLITQLASWRPRLVAVVSSAVVVTTVTVATAAWPHTIAYYNGLIDGTAQGHRYVLDSNLDWNQDIWRLQKFLQAQHFPEVHLALFGSIPSGNIFPTTLPVLGDQDIRAGIQPSGVIVISDGQLYNLDGPFGWLRSMTPQWRVSSSISVFDFR